MQPSCCAAPDDHNHKKRPDIILWGSAAVIAAALLLYFFGFDIPYLRPFAEASLRLLGMMWWGILIGMLFVGLMNKMPREYFQAMLGRGDTVSGIFRAAVAGLFVDMCSHGVLMIGAKLYERGASAAQVMTFLVSSPWNSLSLTIILMSLIGLKWTLIFIAGSIIVAILTGLAFSQLTRKGILPENPNRVTLPAGFSIMDDARQRLKGFRLTPAFVMELIQGGFHEARILLRWLLLGVIIAAAINAFIPDHVFGHWFGPTLLGLTMTMIITTLIEVCSEGSAPIAAEIFHRAIAPGNAFAFLMAGVSTDYTEIMVMRDVTKSWKIALFLPLVSVPQIILLGYIMNQFG